MVTSATQFIKDKGIPAVAAATGSTPGAVRVWKHRNRFPRDAWLQLSVAFPELTLPVLERIEPEREPSSARAA